jgi:hypothetical protein
MKKITVFVTMLAAFTFWVSAQDAASIIDKSRNRDIVLSMVVSGERSK